MCRPNKSNNASGIHRQHLWRLWPQNFQRTLLQQQGKNSGCTDWPHLKLQHNAVQKHNSSATRYVFMLVVMVTLNWRSTNKALLLFTINLWTTTEMLCHAWVKVLTFNTAVEQIFSTNLNRPVRQTYSCAHFWTLRWINKLCIQLGISKRGVQALICAGKGYSAPGKHLYLSWATITDAQATSCRRNSMDRKGKEEKNSISAATVCF